MSNFFQKATFVKGVIGTDPLFYDTRPQVVFIGRSNVGKSSLLNAIFGTKKLVIASSTPGRTRQLNFFLVDESFYFVDFPGYGYAKVGQKEQEKIRKLLLWYFERSDIKPLLVILLIDANVGPKNFDGEMLELLREGGQNFLVVATKADKLKGGGRMKIVPNYADFLPDKEPFLVSSKTGQGVKELKSIIAKALGLAV